MKNTFRSYLIVWFALVFVFSVVALASPVWMGEGAYPVSFWIGFVLIEIAFVCQLGCAYIALQAENAKKMFYNISLLRTSYAGLIASFIFGGVCMLIPAVPGWIGAIVCAIVLAGNVIAVVKATTAIELVNEVDDQVKEKTQFIKLLTVDAQVLSGRAQSDDAKAACKKVYEAIRFSDPVSCDALSGTENEIKEKFDLFAGAVKANDDLTVAAAANELLLLLEERNKKCKVLK